MNLKLNTKAAAFILAFMMIDSGPALAGTVVLSGVASNTCSSYTGFNVDANGNLTVTCADTGPAPTPTEAPSCTLTASPTSITTGSISTLIANCSPAATSFAWTGTNFTGSSGTVNPTSTTSYSVTGTNSAGTGNTTSVVVTVTPASGGGSGSTGTRTVPPTSQSPLADIRAWNAAFERLNSLPPNVKWEPVGYLSYLKQMQAAKPTQIHLPNPW